MNDSGCEPVFIISVAARLLEMHPQTLRKYEREGLIAPSRTTGNLDSTLTTIWSDFAR